MQLPNITPTEQTPTGTSPTLYQADCPDCPWTSTGHPSREHAYLHWLAHHHAAHTPQREP